MCNPRLFSSVLLLLFNSYYSLLFLRGEVWEREREKKKKEREGKGSRWGEQELVRVLNNDDNNNNLWLIEKQSDHTVPGRWPDLVLINKKWTSLLVDFAIPGNHWVKIRWNVKTNKYLYLAREHKKKLWNLRETVVPKKLGLLKWYPKDWKRDWLNWISEAILTPSRLQHSWN